MKVQPVRDVVESRPSLDRRLAGYLAAAGAVGVGVASEAQADIIFNTTVQPFGINGAVPIDFNGDNQVDYEIDHDRVTLSGGSILDYLQIDKNDTNGASLGENLLPINVFDTFPLNATVANNIVESGYVIPGASGSYAAALTAGTPIGPASSFEFMESDNFAGTGKMIRANRLIDEDATLIDQVLGGLTPAQVQVPTNGPNFLGLGGETRYLGVKMELNDAGLTYGWIGIRITNEADATGEVVGWGYETSGAPIAAGQVPEPSSMLLCVMAGTLICGRFFRKRVVGR